MDKDRLDSLYHISNKYNINEDLTYEGRTILHILVNNFSEFDYWNDGYYDVMLEK